VEKTISKFFRDILVHAQILWYGSGVYVQLVVLLLQLNSVFSLNFVRQKCLQPAPCVRATPHVPTLSVRVYRKCGGNGQIDWHVKSLTSVLCKCRSSVNHPNVGGLSAAERERERERETERDSTTLLHAYIRFHVCVHKSISFSPPK